MTEAHHMSPSGSGWRTRFLRRLVLARLGALARGRLVLEDEAEVYALGPGDGEEASVRVLDPSFWRDIARRGALGAGEAWARGAWAADDLVAVLRLLLRNREVLERMDGGLARLSRPLLALGHLLRANTRRGSRSNIAAHYDLSNEFFALVLDETMAYSAGIFPRPDATLAEASTQKHERICEKLELGPRHRVLEIGCGWGGFALHAARRHGCRVTAVTISARQHELAVRRVAAAGLQDRIDVRLCDYRDLEGRYDRVVSIEMVEAVGHRYLGRFFDVAARCLAPDGLFALQAITIPDGRYQAARRRVDFIKRHVFPGSCIPSQLALLEAAQTTSLRLLGLEDLGGHYARTLGLWRENLRAGWARARALGLSDETLRGWEYYLAYCEAGFLERALGDVQMLFAMPRARPRLSWSPLPPPPDAVGPPVRHRRPAALGV